MKGLAYRRLALMWVLSAFATGSIAAAESENKPPNVLFILTDNQAASLLGTYGNPDIRTPNIDRLASEGIQFNRFYAANGMCSPTRATLMTGLMPSQHGLHNWLDDSMLADWPKEWSAVAEFRTLPLTLRNRGYQTALIGKWHLGQPWKPSIGYQHWVTFKDGHTVDFWNNTVIDNGDVYEVNDRHIVDYFTDKAIEYIENYDGRKPFYLQLNYDGPYVNPPTNLGPARNRFYRDYEGKEFKSFPRVAFNANMAQQLVEDEKHNPFIVNMILAAVAMHNDPATMANVASQNTLVDEGVGRVLAALNRKGLDDNTLVIFSSDQGNFYGQHGIWEHTVVTTPANLHETAMHVPLIIRHSTKIKPGRINDSLIAQYDLATTIVNYVGFDDVSFMHSPGKSFAENLHDPGITIGHDSVFFEQEETRGMRTDRYAYWQRIQSIGRPELYDMLEDPEQNVNLYGKPEYEEIWNKLDSELSGFFAKYSDAKYDLWTGGTAKGSVVRPEMFKKIYGDSWRPRTEMMPKFSETAKENHLSSK